MRKDTKQRLIAYIIAIAIPLAVGIFSLLLTGNNMQIYDEITVPLLAPPSWLFSIVWTILYILMGVSSAMIYLKKDNFSKQVSDALGFYLLSLAFNFAWSIIFFNLRLFLVAFIWLIILLYLILRTILSYKRIDIQAAKLQIPYALWVAFAGYLNLAIWILNK